MPSVYGTDNFLPSRDPEQSHLASQKTAPHKREIVIRIYASDDNGKFSDGKRFATAPVPPPTPPDTTAEEKSSDSERETQKNEKSRSTPRRKLSKYSRSRGSEKTPRETTLKRSISNPIRQVHHAKSAETFWQARGTNSPAIRETSDRVSEPAQRLQWQDPHSRESLKRNEQASKSNYGQETKYELNSFNAGDAPVFGSCEKRVRRNHSHESNIVPPSKRGRSRTVDRHAIDGVEPSRSTIEAPLTHDGNTHSHAGNALEPLPSLSLEQFRKAIGWPSVADCPSTIDHPGHQRHSWASTTSAMEATIIDDPARSPRRGLRHTEKRPSLRFAGSPVTNSKRASLTPGFDSPHRLLHKAASISDKDRQNMAPEIDMLAKPTSHAPKRRVDVVPVVVIPERRSSLSSSTPAKGPPRPFQHPSGRRPVTAAGDGTRSSDPPHDRDKSNFVAGPSRGIGARSQSVRRPAVPPRRSSLSAPTSANNSRATSLTSESLHSHTLAMKQAEFKKHLAEKPMPELPPEASRPNLYGLSEEAMKTQSILIGIEDVDNIDTPSMPFSLGSQPSSPGVVEVNEATAVSLFPHNNESLLLVDQQMRNKREPNSKSQALQGGSLLGNIHLPANTVICHVTPPTPMRELEQPQANNNTQETALGRFGSLRRAWTVRNRTESPKVPKRSFSTSATLRKAANRKSENHLHAFWRPRRPCNDSPESAGRVSPTHTPTSNTKQNDNIVNNSLGMPQPRTVMNGPSLPARTRSRRETNQRPRPQPPPPRNPRPITIYNPALNRSTIALGSTATRLNGSEFLDRKSRASRHLRQHSVSWGYQVRFATVRNLRRRFRGRMQQRKEGKHEARREKLKRNIGDVVQVDSAHGNGRGRGRLAKRV